MIGERPPNEEELMASNSTRRGIERRYTMTSSPSSLPRTTEIQEPIGAPTQLGEYVSVVEKTEGNLETLTKKRKRADSSSDDDFHSLSEGASSSGSKSPSPPPLKRQRRRRKMPLPTAAVCLNTLSIGLYDEIDDLRRDLELAMVHGENGITNN